MYSKRESLVFIIIMSCLVSLVGAQNISEALFANPPQETKPKTWMHAMSANMSKEGMTQDLEAMAKAGLGGLLLFNITQGIPYGKIKYNSPEHHEMLTHAAKEAERLGLSFGVHNCDGWSSSGGPWVTPEQSMKMVVWSETVVKGGQKTAISLPKPTAREGFYRDIAVIAYPSLASEIVDFNNTPTITSSDKGLNINIIHDHKTDAEYQLKGKNPWIQFAYKEPFSARALQLVFTDRFGEAKLLTSDDGITFKPAYSPRKVRTGKSEWAFNDNFEAITARFFRFELNEKINLKEINLTATYTLDNPFGRTAIARTEDAELHRIGTPEAAMIIDKNKILDLTNALNTEGVLTTDLPEGNWTILRFGYTSTAASNHPASVDGKGLEVDKLSKSAFKIHYDAFVKKVIDNSKPVAPNALQYIEIDSYEMGGQNWTEGFNGHFKAVKNYDFIPFLPLVAGKFMENAVSSEEILADYREVICDMMTENYFGYFQELCHKDGLKTYIENYGMGPINELEVGSKADIPMGEFWMNRAITQVAAPISSAHIYGKNVISAESFTAEPQINWKGHPAMAKLSGDRAWALGINEFMFHRFAHQANTHVVPGMTMNRWGSHFDRTQTWWYNAGAAWFTYIARGSYLLRGGIPVSDLLVFVGDGTPNATLSRKDFKPNLPMGFNYDNINSDALIKRISVKNGVMVLPEGTTYKALVLKNIDKIHLKTLRKIHEISKSGVPIIGQKPTKLIGYKKDPAEQAEFDKLVREIWTNPKTETNFNWDIILPKYKIFKDLDIKNNKNIEFVHRKTNEADVYFIANPDSSKANSFTATFRVKNKMPELWNAIDGTVKKVAQFQSKGDFTSLDIDLKADESVFVVFRESTQSLPFVSSKKQENVSFNFSKNNALQAKVAKNGNYSAQLANGKMWQTTVKDIPNAFEINKPWTVKFDKNGGYGGTLIFDKLTDWKDHTLDSVRYFSGTATYKNTFNFNKNLLKSDYQLTLDLGQVNIAAQVKINGKDLGVSWIAPYQLDITDVVKIGENTIEIEVTNQWSNRLIGDERFPPNDPTYKLDGPVPTTKMPEWYTNNQPMPKGQRSTFSTADFYKKGDPLIPSGLVGTVRILFEKVVLVKN